SSAASPFVPSARIPPRPAPIQWRTLAAIAAASISPPVNGVGIGGKIVRRFTAKTYHKKKRRGLVDRAIPSFAGCFLPSAVRRSSVDSDAPHRALCLPVLVEDGPQRLVEVLAVAEE